MLCHNVANGMGFAGGNAVAGGRRLPSSAGRGGLRGVPAHVLVGVGLADEGRSRRAAGVCSVAGAST